MDTVIKILSTALWLWFFGAICTYRFGKYLLVEGVGIKSAEFLMLVIFTASGVLYLLFPPMGRWALLAVLVLWLVIQFFCHWYYTIWGASAKKLEGYNRCFADTVHMIPPSSTRLIPDLYHIVLHLLILLDILAVTACIVAA